MDSEFKNLEHLLKAPSKDFIGKLFLEAFSIYRSEYQASESLLKQISESLEIDQSSSEQLIAELVICVKTALFEGLSELNQIQNIFAKSSMPANLKNLLSKLLLEKLPFFKKKLADEQSMLPKLVDFNWRVDIKMASNMSGGDAFSKSGQQACILQLKTDDTKRLPIKKEQSMPNLSSASTEVRPILDIYQIIKLQFAKRSEKQLGLLSFFARIYPSDKCGSNGLPLTPNSIRIYGKFQFLKTLVNKYLTRYIDIQKGSHERLFVISEHYSLNLNDLVNDTYIFNLIIANQILLEKWTFQLLKAFEYLSRNHVVHRFLSLKNICITPEGNLKLNNYGLFFMSEFGFSVNFPILNFVTLAPECLVLEFIYGNKFDDYPMNNNEQNNQLNNSKADVWSVGVVLFQFLFGINTQIEENNKLFEPDRVMEKALNLLKIQNLADDYHDNENLGYEYMLSLYEIDANKRAATEKKIKPTFMKLIKKCLTPNPVKRPDFQTLLTFFKEQMRSSGDYLISAEKRELVNEMYNDTSDDPIESIKWKLYSGKLRSSLLPEKSLETEIAKLTEKKPKPKDKGVPEPEEAKVDHLWRRDVDEVYYLWKLAGGDCLQTLKQHNLLLSKQMPIFKLAVVTTVDDGCEYGKLINDETMFDDTIVPLSMDKLRACLNSIETTSYYPIISESYNHNSLFGENQSAANVIELAQKQPLNIRESYIEYQFHRMILFSRYLISYPYKKEELYEECKKDIPPLYRAFTWPILLNVRFDIQKVYDNIDKESVTPTDRQIDLDVPRCHQYDPLMASPQAHYKLKRLLKAWVVTNPYLVYWQGLDSLSAPFLYLNFNNEAIAYGCLINFVNKYSTRFFLKDNSQVIHEYLAVFSHLIAFHDPELAKHFDSNDFKPDLYAIPWFLTMFAHVFPLSKILHLWDALLMGNNSFPLCIGVSILKQLRNLLLNSDFNECILLFSELPEINIAKCVSDSIQIYFTTPESCLYRQHSYSLDQTTPPVEDPNLDMGPVGLEDLRDQLCPRISTRDVLRIIMASESKDSSLLLIDLRPASEFQQSYVLNSINIPFEGFNFARLSQLADSPAQIQQSANLVNDNEAHLVYLMQQNRKSIKTILTSESRFSEAVKFANKLVLCKFNKICVLNKGIECFASTKLLVQQAS